MSRILVTGACGFIGRRALASLPARGFEVHAVARDLAAAGRTSAARGEAAPAAGDGSGPEAEGGGGVVWHAADLLDAGARRALVERAGASHLLHLAWHGTAGASRDGPEHAAWADATIALAEDFAAAGGVRAVFAGTCAEYGRGAPAPLREDAPIDPATAYGAAKDAARRAVDGLGLAVAWGRVFFVYGPGEDPRRLVASVARAVLAGGRAATTAGDQVRDFLHVDDVAGAFAALAAGDVRGAVNIASGEGVTVRRVAELTAAAAGDRSLLDAGAVAPRDGDPARLVADVTRLREEVGFAPSIGLEDGLAATVAWWRGRPVSATAPRGPRAS